jgi:Rps23 Pro-64 3,4-dihydroxylase Tpa1-like proline 4-hydroxylase
MSSVYDSNIKIIDTYLDTFKNKDISKYLGNWIHIIDNLNKKFLCAEPFEHVIIDNFLNNDYAEKIAPLFPDDLSNWHKYCNPIEVKYAYDNINTLPTDLKDYFYMMACDQFMDLIKYITNITDLEYDPYLHGAGLHRHGTHGKLDIHLDYEKHPYSGKERRINIILFLSKGWKEEWNGASELWNKDVSMCIQKTQIQFNRAIIFKTNDVSWHGMPDKIKCPENTYRSSLAYYYVSPLCSMKSEGEYRIKATYTKRPQDPVDKNKTELYKIRSNRRITNSDLLKYCPTWTINDS